MYTATQYLVEYRSFLIKPSFQAYKNMSRELIEGFVRECTVFAEKYYSVGPGTVADKLDHGFNLLQVKIRTCLQIIYNVRTYKPKKEPILNKRIIILPFYRYSVRTSKNSTRGEWTWYKLSSCLNMNQSPMTCLMMPTRNFTFLKSFTISTKSRRCIFINNFDKFADVKLYHWKSFNLFL